MTKNISAQLSSLSPPSAGFLIVEVSCYEAVHNWIVSELDITELKFKVY